MAGVFFAELGLPRPDHTLGVGGGTHAEQLAGMLSRLEVILASERPDAVLVYGDTNSTLAGALARLESSGCRWLTSRPAFELRPPDARGDQPGRRRPPLDLALRPDADGRRRISRPKGSATA